MINKTLALVGHLLFYGGALICIYWIFIKDCKYLPKELSDFHCEILYKEKYCDKEWLLDQIANKTYFKYGCEICNSLQSDKSFVIAALELNNHRLFSLEDANLFTNDKDVVLKAIRTGSSLEFASSYLKCNKDVVLNAVEANIFNYNYVCSELANDKEVILSILMNSSKSDFELFPFIFYNFEKQYTDTTNTLDLILNDKVFLSEFSNLDYFIQLKVKDLRFITKRLSDENIEFYKNSSASESIHPDFEEAVLIEYIERKNMEHIDNILN